MTTTGSDGPRLRAADDEVLENAQPAGKPGLNPDESPLAWLARRKDKDGRPLLSETEVAAGERLRADFWFAQMTPRVTANWSLLLSGGGGRSGSPDHGAAVPDAVIAAREKVRLALRAAGPDLAGMLIDVCCHLKGLEAAERSGGWPTRSGKVVLQIALRQLARHYGMEREAARHPPAQANMSHWGAPDYKPKLEKGSN